MGSQAVQLLMRLYSYVVARDYGFAPNPFYGWCTLATCKPTIRSSASIGDWVIGTGAKTKYNLAGRLIYGMRVDECLDFGTYWNDSRFASKRPVLNGSLKQVYGDNIYHRERGRWIQEDSHHSHKDGRPNRRNIDRDTSVNRVLVSSRFVYFGSSAPVIPKRFRPFGPTDEEICCPAQGHRTLSQELAREFQKWLEQGGNWGLRGMPLEYTRHPRRTGRANGERGRADGREDR